MDGAAAKAVSETTSMFKQLKNIFNVLTLLYGGREVCYVRLFIFI